uniref:Phage head-tail adaptor n=1 Tax=uncultured bacterium Contig2 TaxID=1393529 RepID=W0FP95_9BACT|nr:phage head-tail adaptor [uncultured bacterium Contig2]
MNKEWSEMNKGMQALLSKEATFRDALSQLAVLRESMFGQITQIVNSFPAEAFRQMPFAGAEGYHSKTLGYSIWHIFRIEDIVAHEMIAEDQQVLFAQGFDRTVQSPVITTGNELAGEEIAEFSKQLNIRELYRYAQAVKESTDRILGQLSYSDLKRRFGDGMVRKLQNTGCVSEDENASWLIAYWCGKDIRGLIQMPFSRHWIMHIEAMQRIKNKLCKTARKGIDPVAYCGLSCNHCFLGEWCGSCRTAYNTCSVATESPDGICPNVKCCREKGFDGCYECDSLESCEKGFYTPSNDGANAAKAQALYIRKHGKKEFLKVQDRLHQKYDFAMSQEILGQDFAVGFRILEEN